MSLITKSDTELYSNIDIANYKFDDVDLTNPLVWNLFCKGDTKGVFQVESQLCRDWCKKIKPSNIDELSALVSLVRPGGLESGFAEKYAKIKNGLEKPSYIHSSLEPILAKTYSCLVFQESILRICVDIAGFDEIQADDARRAVGKKLPEEMDRVRKMFIEGASKKGLVNNEIAEEIFSWIQKSVRYLFNASHSYSYSYISYATAYQKVFFPTEFYTAALIFSSEKLDPMFEIYELVQDAKMHNIKVLPPDIRRHNSDFEIIADKTISFGLAHIRGIGGAAIHAIKELGDQCNTFIGLISNTNKVKRNVVESLIKSGACDCYGLTRSYMLKVVSMLFGRTEKEEAATPIYKKLTPQEIKCVIKNINNMSFQDAIKSIVDEECCIAKRIPTILSKVEELNQEFIDTNTNKSIWERLYLGISLSCSAADDYDKEDDDAINCKEAFFAKTKTKFAMHVVIDDIKLKKTGEKSKTPGRDYCYLTVSDNSGTLNSVVLWPEKFEEYKDNLVQDSVATIYARKDCWNGRDQIVVDKINIIG